MLRTLVVAAAVLAPFARADMGGPRFCDPEPATARALLDADVVLQAEVVEFESTSTPTQVGATYTWKAKVKITSVVFGDFRKEEATLSETCSGGSSDGRWIPPCLEPLPRERGAKATLFLKRDGTFLRTKIEQRHAADCPPKDVVAQAKKQRPAAWAKLFPAK